MIPVLFATLQSSGVTLSRIVADIPHDASAIFIYIFTAVSLWLVVWASRKSAGGPPPPTDHM
ncbi:MAG TPA: hypothetical protein VFQ38_01375 [Longimicrobiales bacterium]|nr:hypothetical protein [Longimicrobiales bacterium]